ncbi:MAG: AAA family ATPase [Bryobacteraceae bacterium]
MMPNIPDIEQLRHQHHAKARAEQPKHAIAIANAQFTNVGDRRYRMEWPAIATVFEVDRLRREHGELTGELCVRCSLPGARAVSDGILGIADLNFNSLQARLRQANWLAGRAGTRDLDWIGLVEEFAQAVLRADREGQPAVDLRDVPRPKPDDNAVVEGLVLPRRHPSILFGDGGAAKSYTALWLAGRLAQQCIRVALFDWELAGEDHRDRLERLFPDGMPQIMYCRCERPLTYEVDRLSRIVRDHRIEYSIFDSVAFACDGPPEAAEIAGKYFRAVRQIGGGSLHIAHISKAEGADQKPFGSTFWHNGARSTWFAQLAETSGDSSILNLGLFNRKANLGRLRAPIGFAVTFTGDHTVFRRAEVAENPDLARKLTVPQRMKALLGKGALTPEQIAQEIDAEAETVKRTVRRHKNLFVTIEGGRIGLLERVK